MRGALEINVPSIHRARMGSDTLIPCTFTVDNPPLDPKYFVVFWYFNGRGILIYNDIVKTEDPRISLNTINSLNGDASLSISRVMVSDKGVYTCAIIHSPERKEKEVTLHVQAPPEITITRRITFINHMNVLRADITGFYPENIEVKWFRDKEILNNYTVSTPQRNRDGTYTMASTVTIMPTEEDKHRSFSCRVQHESLSEPLHEDFQLKFSALEIRIIGRNVDIYMENALSCLLITGFHLEDIDIKWFKDGKLLDQVSKNTHKRESDGTYSVTSTVTIIPIEEDRTRTFSCRVQHESLSESLQEDFRLDYKEKIHLSEQITYGLVISLALSGICASFYYLKKRIKRPGNQDSKEELVPLDECCLEVEEIKVPPHLECNKMVILQCKISRFHPDNVTVTWSKLEQGSQDAVVIVPGVRQWIPGIQYKKQWDNTYSCTSRLVLIPKSRSDDGAVFICRVKHPSLEEPIVRRTEPLQVEGPKKQENNEDLAPLKVCRLDVECIKAPSHLQRNRLVILQCKILMFYQDIVSVTWHKREKGSQKIVHVVTNGRYWIPGLVCEKQQDGKYSCTAHLVFTPSLALDHGAVFICRVEHPSLEEPIEKRTDPLQVMGSCSRVDDIVIQSKNNKIILRCKLSKFDSKNLAVNWYKCQQGSQNMVHLLPNKKYHIPHLNFQKKRDHTYSCTACLIFTPSYELDDGAVEFICKVEHPSLEEAIEKRTEPLQVMELLNKDKGSWLIKMS